MSVTQVTIAPGHWLAPAAAASYQRMRAAGMPAGGITDAGRTYAEQAAMYARYLRGELLATAARPGTSKHETGNALDLSGPAQAWVREHGAAFGWQRDRVAREPWHMEYVLVLDQRLLTPPPTPAPITPRPPQEALMAGPVRIRHEETIYLVDLQRGEFRALDPTSNSLLARLDVPLVWDGLSEYERDQVRQLVRDLKSPKISG